MFSGIERPMTSKIGIQHWVLKYYQVCSNDVLLYGEKVKTMNISETVVVYDIKVGRCNQLHEYMKLYEQQPSRSSTLVQSTQIQYF